MDIVDQLTKHQVSPPRFEGASFELLLLRENRTRTIGFISSKGS